MYFDTHTNTKDALHCIHIALTIKESFHFKNSLIVFGLRYFRNFFAHTMNDDTIYDTIKSKSSKSPLIFSSFFTLLGHLSGNTIEEVKYCC